jgi:putative addiction module killer protein
MAMSQRRGFFPGNRFEFTVAFCLIWRKDNASPAQAKIAIRINRLAAGNFGDCKSLRQGLFELRIDWGPGYRVYYGMIGRDCVLLLCGGDKRKQSADIERALEYLKDCKDKDRNLMKRKASISHDETIIRRLRKDSDFCRRVPQSGIGGRRRAPRSAHCLAPPRSSPGHRQSRQGCRHRA